ncbi:hypothetical protein Tco_1208644 [Tanacetum coccineum]
MAVNNLYQPWRAILSMINQCLTGKTSGFDRPRYPVLQMLWGIITSTNVDYAELMYEEFVQAIQTFLTDKANLGSPTKKGRKAKPHTNAPYYNAYLEMVAKHDQKIAAEEVGKKKLATKADKSKKPATAKQLKPKPVKEKSSKPAPAPKPKMSLESFQAQGQAHVGGVAIRELVAEATRPLPVVEGKGKAIATEEQAAQLLLALHTQKRRSADTDKRNIGGDTKILLIGEEQGDDVANVVNLEEKTAELDEGQAGSDPADEHVILEDPLSSFTNLSSMKNLDDAYNIGDQFIDDKSTEDEPGKLNNHTKHADLYKALERSMARDNMDEFIVEQAKSRKRCRDDQDPPQPPPKESDQSKIKGMILMHLLQDNTLLRSLQPRKQQQASQSEQLIDDVPTSDAVHISDSEDVGVAHLPKIKTPATWLRPLPEKDRPDHPAENKLLQKTGDMGPFIKWFCKRLGKKQLSKSDLEGPTFKVAKASHENSISLQFQMEECHWLLMDQVDLVNPEGHRFVPDMSKSLPLGGPPGQVTIQPQFFFNKDLEYLISGDTSSDTALSRSKLKAANYLNFGLEELVPSL